MAVLTVQQRRMLESAVKQARKLAEQGAFNALQAMAVNHHEPFAHMDVEQRRLRNQLWAKARLLGDREVDGKRSVKNLSYELAYESWHKMLFAKFLEANHLLMHPEGVAVTLEDCEELAKEEGFVDKWDVAAHYAGRMLPAIFRVDDPLMRVVFAANDRIPLESLLEGLENAIFTADDALGWVYQFWQTEAKAVINDSGDKIDGEKLPAVTQLFTEPYMVQFLIDNTLGAWWVSRHPGEKPPVNFAYLRLGPAAAGTNAEGSGQPEEGSSSGPGREGSTAVERAFPGWPDRTADVTVLDPCMGSGHFVASLFGVLAALRMQEEGLSKAAAADKVIAENLHGLELDPRCTQIAAFNLAFTAWRFCGHYKELPEMNLACSGIAPKGREEDWVRLVGDVGEAAAKNRLENGMRVLYHHFQLAPELGSLLDPTTIAADMFTASFEELQPVLKRALEREADADEVERGVMAAGIAKAGQLLGRKYTLQITNVPYLSRGKQDQVMAAFTEKYYPEAKGDLATVFLERMLKANAPGGVSCTVIPQNWLFLTSYRKYRERLLKNETWNFVARLGAKGFQTPMWDFNVMLISLSHRKPQADQPLTGLDVSDAPSAAAKDEALKTAELKRVKQLAQLENPDARVTLENNNYELLLNSITHSHHGLTSGDLPRMSVNFWEITEEKSIWIPFQTTTKKTQYYSGLESLLRWNNGEGEINEIPGARKDGLSAWGKKGVVISQMGNNPACLYIGFAFDNNTAVITTHDNKYFEAIWSFCSSPQFNEEVRKIDQKLNVTNATLVKVPFDLAHWQKIAAEKYPNGLPQPYSDHPTQWLFHGHPARTDSPLQVALARILGYRWPAAVEKAQIDAARRSEPPAESSGPAAGSTLLTTAGNGIFDSLAEEAKTLIEAAQAFDHFTDEDGIFCIPSVNGEQAGAERLREYLQAVFAADWHHQTILQLLRQEAATASQLEDYLRNEFFVRHCKLFKNRPFIWHIWDGRKDGFSVLVNYHRLTKDNLSKLIYTYLGDWIRMCEAKKKAGESGAEGLLSAALKLKEKLEAILEGEAPYDIFVRWKPLAQQPLGWDPDLNDGVRLNIRPFVEADVLRKKPNIKWGVDRGKNPPDSPWGVLRDNDKHLRLAEKRAAKEKQQHDGH